MEEKKRKYLAEEQEIQNRIKVLQEKEFYLRDKFEEFDRLSKDIKQREMLVAKEKYEVTQAAKRLERNLAIFEENSRALENEKEQLNLICRDMEAKQSEYQREELNLEQQKAEFKMRMTSVDQMRAKYLTSGGFNEQHNKSYATEVNKSQSGYRTGFSSVDYINKLKGKFNQSRLSYEPRTNFNSYINREKEYVSKVNEEMYSRNYGDFEDKMKRNIDIMDVHKRGNESFDVPKIGLFDETGNHDLFRESGKVSLDFMANSKALFSDAKDNEATGTYERGSENKTGHSKSLSQNNFVKKDDKKGFASRTDDDFDF